ncbi:MAG TPA: hypothetical protein VGC42_11760 [Kofleriaceae bacterium]
MLRLLGLHGYHGSAAGLRGQAAALADAIAPVADLVCVDAPSLASGDFGWWHASQEGAGVRYRGWEKTRDGLAGFCARSGPFDGVLGFSQGAALAALLVALGAFDGAAAPRFDFAIAIGGFASRDPGHAAAFEVAGGIDVPTLHVIGRRDGIVAPRASHALASRFRGARVVEHDGGHVIPADAGVRAATAEFLDAMARRPASRARATLRR